MLKERLNTYSQHIRQPELQQIDVEGHIRTCGAGSFKIMPFFAIREAIRVSEAKKCSFFAKFGVLCFLVKPVLRFALLPYYRRFLHVTLHINLKSIKKVSQ